MNRRLLPALALALSSACGGRVTLPCPGVCPVECAEECSVEETCIDGVCVPILCAGDEACPAVAPYCLDGACRIIECVLDSHCDPAEVCDGSWCAPRECEEPGPCANGLPCVAGICRPVLTVEDLPCEGYCGMPGLSPTGIAWTDVEGRRPGDGNRDGVMGTVYFRSWDGSTTTASIGPSVVNAQVGQSTSIGWKTTTSSSHLYNDGVHPAPPNGMQLAPEDQHWFRILPGPTLEPATLGLATCGEFVGEDLVCHTFGATWNYLRFDAQGPTVLLEYEATVDPRQFDAGFGRVCYWGGELGGQEQELSFVDVETGEVTSFVIPDDPDGLFERPLACGETRIFLHKIFTTTLRERDYDGALIREHEIESVYYLYPDFFARGIGERFWVWREGPTATFSSGASVGAIVWALDRATGLQFRLPSSPYIPFEVITWGDYIAWTMVVGDQGIVRLVRVAP